MLSHGTDQHPSHESNMQKHATDFTNVDVKGKKLLYFDKKSEKR